MVDSAKFHSKVLAGFAGLGLVISTLISSSAFAQKACGVVHEPFALEEQKFLELKQSMPQKEWNEMQVKALEFVDEIADINKKIENYRRINGGTDSARVLAARRRIQLLRVQISMGQGSAGVNQFRMLFHNVEFSYWKIKRNSEVIQKQIDQGLAQSELVKILRAENEKMYVAFGESYGEYKAVRDFLENQLGKNPDLDSTSDVGQQGNDKSKTAHYIYKNLGIHNLHLMLPDLKLPEKRVSMSEISHFFQTSPEALLAKLRADRKAEKVLAIRMAVLNYPLFNFLKAGLYKLPMSVRGPVSKVLGIAYDAHVRDRYIDYIEQVVSVRGQKQVQVDLLRELNSQSDAKDEMLVTFARVTNHTEVWSEVRENVRALSETSSIYKEFSVRMEEAESSALKLGDISLFHKPSTVQNLLAVTNLASTLWVVYNWPMITQHSHSLFEYIRVLFHL